MTGQRSVSLHVTNGDAVVHLFRKAGILGTHLPWRDALHEGPVPPLSSLEQLSALRGAYLAKRGFGKPIKILHDFAVRDAAIRKAVDYAEIVLWFEHDLYDQLQIAQVLVTLDSLGLEPGRVSAIASDRYLGSMTADEIAALHPKRRTVTHAGFAAAARLWTAFTGGDPAALLELTRRDLDGLPYARAALLRLCQEFPWSGDRLSRSQRHALEAAAQGPASAAELFRRAQAREDAPFLGDALFEAMLADLLTSPSPLLERLGEALVPSATGRSILAGDGTWLDSPARWIGGVDLAVTPYLWDETAGRFLPGDQAASR